MKTTYRDPLDLRFQLIELPKNPPVQFHFREWPGSYIECQLIERNGRLVLEISSGGQLTVPLMIEPEAANVIWLEPRLSQV